MRCRGVPAATLRIPSKTIANVNKELTCWPAVAAYAQSSGHGNDPIAGMLRPWWLIFSKPRRSARRREKIVRVAVYSYGNHRSELPEAIATRSVFDRVLGSNFARAAAVINNGVCEAKAS